MPAADMRGPLAPSPAIGKCRYSVGSSKRRGIRSVIRADARTTPRRP